MSDKVLIVDDDPSICKLLEKVMKSNDLEPTIATCGKDALSLLRTHTFDLILMDGSSSTISTLSDIKVYPPCKTN